MKDFVFIIPLTPKQFLNPVRQVLFNMMVYSLRNQTSDNWTALLLGEEEYIDGNLVFIDSEKPLVDGYKKEWRSDAGHTDKHHKIEVALQYITKSKKKPRYLIRLDDDDLISPNVVDFIDKDPAQFDCYADRYQALYNIADGKIALPKLNWLANSVFHKYEHAVSIVPGINKMLINCSHSDYFHLYYADKQVHYFQKHFPLYLRIFSNSSLHISTSVIQSANYHTKKYGFWYYFSLPEFEIYINMLIEKIAPILKVTIKRKKSLTSHSILYISYFLSKTLTRVRSKLKQLLNNK